MDNNRDEDRILDTDELGVTCLHCSLRFVGQLYRMTQPTWSLSIVYFLSSVSGQDPREHSCP